jgi:hypothetical protein
MKTNDLKSPKVQLMPYIIMLSETSAPSYIESNITNDIDYYMRDNSKYKSGTIVGSYEPGTNIVYTEKGFNGIEADQIIYHFIDKLSSPAATLDEKIMQATDKHFWDLI